jgi:hypothetical protein
VAEEEVGIRLSLKERRETASGLKEISGDLGTVGRQAQTSGRLAGQSSKGFSAMRRTGRAAALGIKLGFAAALGAGYAAVKLLKSSFSEARESERVGKVTEARIKSTGKAANLTAKQIGRLSFALGKKTAIDDETIQSGANVLLTFTKLQNLTGKGNKIFTRATKAATDLAASFAGNNGSADLTSSATMVGKALQDPIKGVTALAKKGVDFDTQQKEQIKTLVESGHLLSAQKIILRELGKEYGGTARAQATMGDKVAFAWGNIQERLGTVLLPLLNQVERWFLNKGLPVVNRWVGVFQRKGVPAISDFVKKARPLANEVLPALGSVLGDVKDVLADAAPYAVKLVRAFNNMPGWAKKGLAIGGLATFAASKTGLLGTLLKGTGSGGSSGGLLGLVSKAKPVPVFVTNQGFGGAGGPGGLIPSGGGDKPGTLGKFGRFGSILASIIGQAPAGVSAGAIGNEVLPTPHVIEPGTKEYFEAFGRYGNLIGAVNGAIDDMRNGVHLTNGDLKDLVFGGLGLAETHTKSFSKDLDKAGKTHVAPSFSTPGLDESRTSSQQYVDILTHRVPKSISTTFSVSTSSALSSIQHVFDVATSGGLGGFLGGHRERGGPVKAGRPYIVGEKRPELFVPTMDGNILPRIPGAGDSRDAGSAAAERPIIHTHVYLKGREIALAVSDEFETTAARA